MTTPLPRKVFHTALCIIPPLHLYPLIQQHRSQYDTSFHRWMPHFNICFPFVTEKAFEEVYGALCHEFADMEPFEVRLGRDVQFFDKGRGSVMWIQPMHRNGELDELMRRVLRVVPHCNEAVERTKEQSVENEQESSNDYVPAETWHPHITLGRPNQRAKQQQQKTFESSWHKLRDEERSFTVAELCIIMREGKEGAMEVKYRVPLSGGGDKGVAIREEAEKLRAPDVYDSSGWQER